MHLETWHKILVACDVDTVTGLHRYVEAWGARDPVVSRWMLGSLACQRPTADIGGWLADYCNTAFLALSGQAQPNVIHKLVETNIYGSLAPLIGPISWPNEKAGNVLEQLCWHAYEHDKGAFCHLEHLQPAANVAPSRIAGEPECRPRCAKCT